MHVADKSATRRCSAPGAQGRDNGCLAIHWRLYRCIRLVVRHLSVALMDLHSATHRRHILLDSRPSQDSYIAVGYLAVNFVDVRPV